MFGLNYLWLHHLFTQSKCGCHGNSDPENSDLRPQTRKLRPRNLRPLEFYLKNIYVVHVNSSQFLSSNVLWSCNIHRQQPERSKIFYLLWFIAVTSIKHKKLTRFKIAADILMAFAGEFFTKEIEDTESL